MQRIDAKRCATVAPDDVKAGDKLEIAGKTYTVESDAKKSQTVILIVKDEGGIDMGEPAGIESASPKYTRRSTRKQRKSKE